MRRRRTRLRCGGGRGEEGGRIGSGRRLGGEGEDCEMVGCWGGCGCCFWYEGVEGVGHAPASEKGGVGGEEAVLPCRDVEHEWFGDRYGCLGVQIVEEGFYADAFVGGVLVDQGKQIWGFRGADTDEDEFSINLGDDVGGLERGFGDASG